MTPPAGEPVLQVRDLEVTFPTEDGLVYAVRGVSFEVHEGEVLGIVGESGSGKSVSAMAAMGLLPKSAQIGGSITFRGEELLGQSERDLERLRGSSLSMIFQDPMTSLNPVMTVGDQIAETVRIHQGVNDKAGRRRAAELLSLVGIPNAEQRVDSYPHEFSGGMRQRAMIAIAIANDPDVLIADEPTTALDVTIQAQVLDVLETVQEATGSAIILITHDLGVVARSADRVFVMYAGRPAEIGAIEDVFERPTHPYTEGLLRSIPRLDDAEGKQLVPIEGSPPSMLSPPPGCAFHPRCPRAQDVCVVETPLLRPVEGHEHRRSRCHFAEDVIADPVIPT